jgi:hypothetical protein
VNFPPPLSVAGCSSDVIVRAEKLKLDGFPVAFGFAKDGLRGQGNRHPHRALRTAWIGAAVDEDDGLLQNPRLVVDRLPLHFQDLVCRSAMPNAIWKGDG